MISTQKKSISWSPMGFFRNGHVRSIRAKKNIAASFLIKALNIAIGLMIVPLTINYLDPTRYGIWITLSSLIAWFGFFDIGLGHGLRNRFAEALATGQHELARVYVSTTYAILSIIIGSILLLFYVANPFINWNLILNASQDVVAQTELSILALVVFTFFCLRFIFKLIATILMADQRPALASTLDLFGNILVLLLVFLLIYSTKGSLLYLGVAMSFSPVFVLLTASLLFFKGKYRLYSPSAKFVDLSRSGDLLTLGFKFFIIQIAAVLLYQTNTIIIAQLFGPDQVTPYFVAFKYFSVLIMGFTIVITPFWSAFTEAWAKQEIQWIKNVMRKLFWLWGGLLGLGLIMLISSQWVFSIWVGEKVTVNHTISTLICAWVLLNAWNGIFSQFLNGVGKLQLQLRLGIMAAMANVPLAVFLGMKIGIEGVLLANLIVNSIGVWVYPLQCYKILNNKASGFWNG